MASWWIAAAVGLGLAAAGYVGRSPGTLGARLAAAAVRALAVTLIVAVLLDAPLAPSRAEPPVVALDISASWLRGGDATAYTKARAAAESLGTIAWTLGDVAGNAPVPSEPAATRSRLGAVVDRAVADGRAVALVTDGELEDADALARLPRGSSVVLRRGVARPDAAVASLTAPPVAIAGDTIDAMVTLAAGEAGAPSGAVTLSIGTTVAATHTEPTFTPFEERSVRLRAVVPTTAGTRLLVARWSAAGDVEPRNDTLAVALDVTARPTAVFVSTSPDADARWFEAAMRTTMLAPTRSFWRVAPQRWRDGAQQSVDESVVKAAVSQAPLVVLHGDTSYFGALRTATHGALLLIAPPEAPAGAAASEWFAVALPASPLSSLLSPLPWDSLPPLDVSASAGSATSAAVLEARLGRRGDARRAISAETVPTRRVVVGAAGFARWMQRGGAAAEAFTSLSGALVGWLVQSTPDVRAAIPVGGVVREGDPLRWRRGSTDTLVVATLARRGGPDRRTDTLRFAAAANDAVTAAIARGVWDVTVAGGAATIVVNPSGEWVPRRPTVAAGPAGTGPAGSRVPRSRDARWLYLAIIGLLCGEWLLRRRIGLR